MSRKSPVFLAVAVFLLVAFPALAASPDPEIFASQSSVAAPNVLRLPAVQAPMQIAEAARQMQSRSMLAESNDQSNGSGGSWVSRHKVLTVILIIAAGGGIYAASRGGYHKPSGGGNDPGRGY